MIVRLQREIPITPIFYPIQDAVRLPTICGIIKLIVLSTMISTLESLRKMLRGSDNLGSKKMLKWISVWHFISLIYLKGITL